MNREEIALQYQPLVHKITNQWKDRLPLTQQDILGFAEQGLVVAINTYDPKKKNKNTGKVGKQTFKQYAAWCILHEILNGANNEGHIVKMSAYHQKKRKESGSSTYIYKSINIAYDDEGEYRGNIPELSETDPYIGMSDVYNKLYTHIEQNFSKRDCDVFYRFYGLKNKEPEQGKKIAESYDISPCTVTLITKKIIKSIQQNPDLCEELEELL